MDRRQAIVAIAAMGSVLSGRISAQQRLRIGYLSGNPKADTEQALARFRARLNELGWQEARNLSLELRYADGKYDRLPALARELVESRVDVVFTYGTPGSLAAKKATQTTPIVFAGVADPIGVGLVTQLRRPGANLTGVTSNNPALAQKRLSLLRDIVPGAPRIAVLTNPDFQPSATMLDETRAAARLLGVRLQVFEARTPDDLPGAFQSIHASNIRALAVLVDPMFIAQHKRIADLALERRVASIYHLRQFVDAGGLISYGVDYDEAFEQAAILVDKVARGAKAGEIAVEQPWRFPLVVNARTAKAIGVKIPPEILLRADHVIH